MPISVHPNHAECSVAGPGKLSSPRTVPEHFKPMTHDDAAAAAPGGTLRAQAVLDRGNGPEILDFDAVSLSTDDPASIVVALADGQGRTLTIILPRAEVKRLLSWRTLMSL